VVLGDHAELGGPTRAAEVVEELDVGLVVLRPLLGDVVLVVDRLDGADRLACTAVDALVGVDVEAALTLVDAVDRTLLDTGLVLEVDTGLRAPAASMTELASPPICTPWFVLQNAC